MKKTFARLAWTAILATTGAATAFAHADNPYHTIRRGGTHWPSHGVAAKAEPPAKLLSPTPIQADSAQVETFIELKDGSTIYIFKDGKMGMVNKFGRATYMASGHVMETKDGEKIIMNGNEIWRVEQLLHKDCSGGG